MQTRRKKASLRAAEYRSVLALVIWLMLGAALMGGVCAQSAKTLPKTRTDNVRETLHGVEIVDPYRWLEDQKSPETRAWIHVQNEYTQSMLGKQPGRNEIKRRLAELMKTETVSVPDVYNGRYFFTKRLPDQDLPVICMRKGPGGPDETLVDPHPLSPDHTTGVTIMDVSKDGTLLAYGVRQGGEDEVAVHFLGVDTRKDWTDRLPRARYADLAIKPDKKGLYYARFSPKGPRVYYHEMGTGSEGDVEIFGKNYGPDKLIRIRLSEDGRYLLFTVSYGSSGSKTEVYYQEVVGHGPITPIVKDLDARFMGAFAGTHLYLQTNWEAPNGRIFDVNLNNPARNRWREVIATAEAPITGFALVGGKLFVSYMPNVRSRVKVYETSGKYLRDITFPTISHVGGLKGRWDSPEAFFTFDSFQMPETIYRYEVATGKQAVWHQPKAPIDAERFEVKQVWYESKDGTRVPMFLVHGKGLKLDGAHPTWLTGYGGFNISRTPHFSAAVVTWVERGGVYALPNLRGGGEFGETWHKAGMFEKKQNVFDDFIAAAEWLIKNGYTSPAKLAITGGSNGGLLVGAALTQRPELFGAVVCSVPLLDMIRYHRFLVARFWVSEYGSSEDPAQFRYIHAYSPYHQIKPGAKYPAVMFVTGDADTRVDPLHARKMTARLQAANASNKPILLHYDTKAGHSAGKPVSKQIDDTTDELVFMLWQLDVNGKA